MKYIVMLGDGMADWPAADLGGKTPLEVAKKPNIDSLVPYAELGMLRTVPEGMKPGSDVANLSTMGYDPMSCYTGRSPLEAVSMGIEMSDTDVALRCNLITLSEEMEYSDKVMVDYSAGEITTEEAAQLIHSVAVALSGEGRTFYPGISYRHCMIWKKGPIGLNLTPPHDITDRKITEFLPENPVIFDLMMRSHKVLKDHPVNLDRQSRGLRPANSIWLWGEGTRPLIALFEETHGVQAAVISAVDLVKGIGLCAGMKVIEVAGATGNIHTNFKGKAEAALKALLNGQDLVYIHVEAPDECAHQGDALGKVHAIELIDEHIVGPLLAGLGEAAQEYAILVLPDHPTPLAIKTHTADPVPYMLYCSKNQKQSRLTTYTEAAAKATGVYLHEGHRLMNQLLQRK